MINARDYAKEYRKELYDKLSQWVDKHIKEAVREGRSDTNFLVSECYYPVKDDLMKCYARSGGYTFSLVLNEGEHMIYNVSW